MFEYCVHIYKIICMKYFQPLKTAIKASVN